MEYCFSIQNQGGDASQNDDQRWDEETEWVPELLLLVLRKPQLFLLNRSLVKTRIEFRLPCRMFKWQTTGRTLSTIYFDVKKCWQRWNFGYCFSFNLQNRSAQFWCSLIIRLNRMYRRTCKYIKFLLNRSLVKAKIELPLRWGTVRYP